jgi:hypothetical protein
LFEVPGQSEQTLPAHVRRVVHDKGHHEDGRDVVRHTIGQGGPVGFVPIVEAVFFLLEEHHGDLVATNDRQNHRGRGGDHRLRLRLPGKERSSAATSPTGRSTAQPSGAP